MTKPKKRWHHYQVDGPQYTHPDPRFSGRPSTVKSVAELTETEAKDELCDTMDLIKKLVDAAHIQLDYARKAKYYI